jgi:pimeloyl-ACP methyl ester carboxylesterase
VTAALDGKRAYLRALASHAGIDAQGIDPPAERRVEIDGLALHYLEWGNPEAQPLVLLHGGGQSAHTWDPCCLILARRYRCLALDQRGHGDSDWSPAGAYAIQDHVRDIAGFVDRLALRQPIMAGMSMGGINAIAYAVEHASALRALVSVDVGPDVQFEPVERLMQGLGAYRHFKSPEDAAERLSKLGARRARSLLKDTLSRNLRRERDGGWTWKYDPRTLVGLSAEDILAPRKPLWDVLGRITCPVLVVRGADSAIFSAANASEFARRLPRGTCVTVPNARHSVQTDNPRGLAEAVIAFDDGLPSRATECNENR